VRIAPLPSPRLAAAMRPPWNSAISRAIKALSDPRLNELRLCRADENVLGQVPHRQYVFTVPRMLRPIFSRRRGLLGELCHSVERSLIQAYFGAGVEGRPGLIPFVQTFGDLVTFNPHIHVFDADSRSPMARSATSSLSTSERKPALPLNSRRSTPSGGAQRSEINVRCNCARVGARSHTELRRGGKPFRLRGRIDSPIPIPQFAFRRRLVASSRSPAQKITIP
jgi:hypothetical protein